MLFKIKTLNENSLLKYYSSSYIKKNEIVLQESSKSGLEGSLYYILNELCKNFKFKNFKKYIVLKEDKIEYFLKQIKNKNFKNVKILVYGSDQYYKKLYEAKFLICNCALPNNFIKKQNQVYINIVDEIPLIHIGRDNKISSYSLGNMQRNFLMADYVICANEYTLNIIRKAYMLDNIYNGKYIICGLPKNDIFFQKNKQEKLKKKINPKNLKIIVYAPVKRNKTHIEEQKNEIKKLLQYLNNNLDEDYLVYSKIDKKIKINYEEFNKIKKFPKKYEFNQVLSISNVFITDYSSSLFDYSIMNNQIISYMYDIKTFKEEIGLYLNIEEEPSIFATNNLEKLLYKIKNNDDISNNNLKKYILNELGDATSNICNILINKLPSKVIDAKEFNNNKENVVIFTGSLIKNGITSALKGLINNIDLTKRNYYLTFFKDEVKKNNYLLNEFPKDINYIPIDGEKIVNKKEDEVLRLFYEENIYNKKNLKIIENVYKREINRLYPNIKFDYAIDFQGYNKEIINLFMQINSIKIRYTHSNLKEEFKIRQNIHMPSLKLAYQNYDKVIAIRENMDEEINNCFADVKPKKLEIVHNLNNIEDIICKSNLPIEFEQKTYSNISKDKLENILNNPKIIKFINIARFSKEKGLDRLINCFNEFCINNNLKEDQVYLIIIGGHGKEFENICKQVQNMNLKNVIIIKNIRNPLSILKKCNLFVLSSYYEGLPITIMEALILNIPVVTVDIEPKYFFRQGYVYLVENSEKGIIDGMNDYINGKINNLKRFDAMEFNKKALKEFENIF